jgi:hypothetical protein
LNPKVGSQELPEKTCRTCKAIKLFVDFQPSGYRSKYPQCRQCNSEKRKRYRKDYPERDRAQRREYFYKNGPRCLETSRKYWLKKKFGITVEDYNVMLARQGGFCAICGAVDKARHLAVDHCHKTGKVRGLLCSKCNTAIGSLEDSVVLIGAALGYLVAHRSKASAI